MNRSTSTIPGQERKFIDHQKRKKIHYPINSLFYLVCNLFNMSVEAGDYH